MPTGNTQQVINYGASANDGQGDPLRTAFIKTDDNFDNVWLAGPVGSNVRITNNTIGVIDTNGNLILSPNGIGVIQTNNHVVPRLNRTYDLGTANLTYRTVYANTATFQTLGITGDLSVGGNLTVSGNIIQVGNIVTETLTIQLANAAITANAANGSGITVGANDNIATLLYNSASNVWTTNIGVSAIGNISAPYFIGNGRQLTGIVSSYGNANVAANLAAFGSNPISTTGNISGGFILGNISQANGFPATYGNANVANYLPIFSGNISAGNISAAGNISGARILGNGSQLTNLPAPTVTQDITSNGAMSIMTYDGVIKYVNYATVEPSSGNIAAGNISTTGNVAGNYFVGLLGSITNLDSLNFTVENISALVGNNGVNIGAGGNNNLVVLPDEVLIQNVPLRVAGNILSTVAGGLNITANTVANGTAQIWNFGTDGSTIFPTLTVTRGDRTGTLTGQTLLFGDSTQEAIISTPDGTNDINASQRFVINPGAGAPGTTGEGGDIYLYAGRGGNVGGSGGDIKIRGGLGPVNGDGGYINIEGGEASADGQGGAIEIFGGQSGNAAGGSLYIEGGYGRTGGDANVSGGFGATGPGGDVSIIGGGSANGQAEYGNVIVATGSKNWRFDNTGNLVLPNNGVVYETSIPGGALTGNTISLKPQGGTDADQQLLIYPTAGPVTDDNHLHLTTGNLYNTELFLGNDNLYVKLANTGNIVVNSNNGVGNTAQWIFGANGNLTVPGGIVGSGASPAPTLSGFSSVSAITVSASGNVSGNYILGNGSQLTGIAASYGNANVVNFLANGYGSNTIVTTGNITAGNLIGNISITGNVTGTSANVTLVAGAYSTVFDNTGNATFANGTVSLTTLTAAGNITGNTAGFAIGYRDIPQVSLAANVTTALTDAGKHYYSTSASNLVLTIANNASQGFQVGAAITVVNQGSGTISIAQGSGVTLYLAGNVTSGNRSVATFGMATIMKVATNTWFINGTGVS